MYRFIAKDELTKCSWVIHGASLACAGISFIAGEGAAVGADTWFLRGTQGLMFTQLASLLRVPLSASTLYAIKEMWSGLILGVAGAEFLISWLGIGAHALTAGTASVPITFGVRSINSTLSAFITEMMGWGYVKRVENGRMALADQIQELGTYALSNECGKAIGMALDGLANITDSDAVKSMLMAFPRNSREFIGFIYTQLHDTGVDEYSSKFLLSLLSQYQACLLRGEPVLVSELSKNALINTATYIVLDKSLDFPVTNEMMEKRAQIQAKVESNPEVFREFIIRTEDQFGVLETPTHDLLNKFKDKQALGVVSSSAAEAIKSIINMMNSPDSKLGQSKIACCIPSTAHIPPDPNVDRFVKNLAPIEYRRQVENIYIKHLSTISASSDLKYIYGQCGKVYEDISRLNVSCRVWERIDIYDHFLIFVIAGWILNNVKHPSLSGLTQIQVAEGITSQILTWLEGEKSELRVLGISFDPNIDRMIRCMTPVKYRLQIGSIYARHLSGITASSESKYIYGQCGKVYEDISKLNVSCGLWVRIDAYDHVLAFVIAGWVLHNVDHPSLKGLTQIEIAERITSQIFDWLEGERAAI